MKRAARGPGGDESGFRSFEWVEHDAVRFAERTNEGFQCLSRLLRRVKLDLLLNLNS